MSLEKLLVHTRFDPHNSQFIFDHEERPGVVRVWYRQGTLAMPPAVNHYLRGLRTPYYLNQNLKPKNLRQE